MSPSSHRPRSDRNLLFGVLAVQLNFISRDDLLAGMSSWVQHKDKPLDQILVTLGKLTTEQATALDALIVQHIKAHDNDLEKSLRALSWASTVASWLTPIDDADLQAGLSMLLDDHEVSTVDQRPSPNGERYQKLQRHDDGGQGIVWLARDTELGRNIALKEIKPEFADEPQTRNRLLLETKVTGQLEHPGIVPIHDVGHDPAGRPYYVMRFLAGGPLAAAIESFHETDQKPGRDPGERRLAFRHLLRRYVDVCNAVAYAHSRGVLHRDLKPKNVMIGRFGETWVIDWGMTRMGVEVQPARSPADEPPVQSPPGYELDETLPGVIKGTIPYMSPEQALGRSELGKTSDVYSLGAILCELLSGQRAFTSDAKTPEKRKTALLALVQKGQFRSPRELNPTVPPALDAICRKAMSFEMTDRYQSATELAEDIEHWLADEPVRAYPEPWTARVSRWGRRHRAAVVGAVVFLVSAVVCLAVTAALVAAAHWETEKQRRIATANYVLARDLSFRAIDLMESAEVEYTANHAQHTRRKDILVTAARSCQQFQDHDVLDTEFRRRAAQVYRYTANVHRMEADTELAEPLFLQSIELLRKLIEENPTSVLYREKLAATLRDYAYVQQKRGKLKEAALTFAEAIQQARALADADAAHTGYQRLQAVALLGLASVQYVTTGQRAESAKTVQRVIDTFEPLARQPVGQRHPYDPLMLAAALNLRAANEREAGQKKAAITTHREAVKLMENMDDKRPFGTSPNDVIHYLARCRFEQTRTWATSVNSRGNAIINSGAVAQQWQQLAQAFPTIPEYRELQATAYQVRGVLLLEENKVEEARKELLRAREILMSLVQQHANLPGYHVTLARACLALARSEGQQPAAGGYLKEAAAAQRTAAALSPDHVDNAPLQKEVQKAELAR